MKVSIKRFNVGMEVKTNGVEFEVRSTNGKEHKGDLILTKSGMVWCPGAVTKANGHHISWDKFIEYAQSEFPKGKGKGK